MQSGRPDGSREVAEPQFYQAHRVLLSADTCFPSEKSSPLPAGDIRARLWTEALRTWGFTSVGSDQSRPVGCCSVLLPDWIKIALSSSHSGVTVIYLLRFVFIAQNSVFFFSEYATTHTHMAKHYFVGIPFLIGLLWWLRCKESACNAGYLDLILLGRSPGGGHGSSLQYCCLENPHGQRSLAGYSPWGLKESDTTEWLSTPLLINGDCFKNREKNVQVMLHKCRCSGPVLPGKPWEVRQETLGNRSHTMTASEVSGNTWWDWIEARADHWISHPWAFTHSSFVCTIWARATKLSIKVRHRESLFPTHTIRGDKNCYSTASHDGKEHKKGCIYGYNNHFAIQQKSTQCQSAILQLKKKKTERTIE